MKLTSIRVLVILLTICLNSVIYAQEIEWYVYNYTNEPIYGVSIFLNSEKLTETNSQGRFVLPETFALPITLRLEHPDYFINEVKVKQNNSTFQLLPLSKSESLEEINISTTFQKDTLKKLTSELILPTEVITAEKLDAYSLIDLISVINETPGVFIHSGAINTNRITIRGVGSRTLYGTNKIKAYFNGIPITNGVGETALDTYDPEDLKSIEIIKGPKSTLYGTNLGGTILLNSKYPKSKGYSIDNRTTVGSFGLFKNSTSSSFSDENLSLHFNYDHLEMDGYRENGRYNRNSYFLNSSYKLSDKAQISLLVNHTNYTAQIPSSIGKTDYLENPTKAAFTWGQAKGYEADKNSLVGL